MMMSGMMVYWQPSVRRYLMCGQHLFCSISCHRRQTICSVNYEFLLSLLYFVDQVHMEADRKAMSNQVNVPADLSFQSRTTYRIRNKVACAPQIIAFFIALYLVSMHAELGAPW